MKRTRIANLSNAAALLNQFLDEINWVGFYLYEEDQLILGPFQGLPACVRIPMGKGVCGTSAATEKTLRIEDVHQFPGHIACDAASRSEIVIPLMKDGKLLVSSISTARSRTVLTKWISKDWRSSLKSFPTIYKI